MTVNYTTLLGLAKPVTGTESGTWGDTVNNNLTDYLDAAVAGTQIISGSLTAVTLSKTTGASLSQAGSGATGSSQYQIIRCTGNPASLLTITAPAADKTYIVINATSTSQSVKIVGAGPTTGVTITAGSQALVAWNGTDFVNITPAVTGYLATTGGTMTGNLTLAAYTETVYTLGTSGSLALNPANGTVQSCAAAGTVTFTDSLSSGQSISLLLTNGSTYTINWPTITWVTSAGNVAPTLSASNTLVFWKISTTLYGALVGKSA